MQRLQPSTLRIASRGWTNLIKYCAAAALPMRLATRTWTANVIFPYRDACRHGSDRLLGSGKSYAGRRSEKRDQSTSCVSNPTPSYHALAMDRDNLQLREKLSKHDRCTRLSVNPRQDGMSRPQGISPPRRKCHLHHSAARFMIHEPSISLFLLSNGPASSPSFSRISVMRGNVRLQ